MPSQHFPASSFITLRVVTSGDSGLWFYTHWHHLDVLRPPLTDGTVKHLLELRETRVDVRALATKMFSKAHRRIVVEETSNPDLHIDRTPFQILLNNLLGKIHIALIGGSQTTVAAVANRLISKKYRREFIIFELPALFLNI